MGGRYVSEENSYIGANTIAIAPHVSGVVTDVSASQNQRVEARVPLFKIDPEPYRNVTNVNSIDVGAYLTAGQQAMSMVATQNAWADSNLRETDLTNVKPGDRATVEADTYPDHPFQAYVQTINPATGAVFALIPPQNASGNWVKVVQRVPVRVAIEHGQDDPVLRNGLSATVTIDTGNRRTLATLWRDILGCF